MGILYSWIGFWKHFQGNIYPKHQVDCNGRVTYKHASVMPWDQQLLENVTTFISKKKILQKCTFLF